MTAPGRGGLLWYSGRVLTRVLTPNYVSRIVLSLLVAAAGRAGFILALGLVLVWAGGAAAQPTQPASTAHPGQAPAAAAPDSRQAMPSGDGEASDAPAKPRVWPIPARGTRLSRP